MSTPPFNPLGPAHFSSRDRQAELETRPAKRIAVFYATQEGHTKEIAERIMLDLRKGGFDVDLHDVRLPIRLEGLFRSSARGIPEKSRLIQDHGLGLDRLRLQNFVDKKQVGEQRAEMNRSVQVIDELRTDGGLGEDQMHGGESVAGVTLQRREEFDVRLGRLQVFLFQSRGKTRRQTGERLHGAIQEIAQLAARRTAFPAGSPWPA